MLVKVKAASHARPTGIAEYVQADRQISRIVLFVQWRRSWWVEIVRPTRVYLLFAGAFFGAAFVVEVFFAGALFVVLGFVAVFLATPPLATFLAGAFFSAFALAVFALAALALVPLGTFFFGGTSCLVLVDEDFFTAGFFSLCRVR